MGMGNHLASTREYEEGGGGGGGGGVGWGGGREKKNRFLHGWPSIPRTVTESRKRGFLNPYSEHKEGLQRKTSTCRGISDKSEKQSPGRPH